MRLVGPALEVMRQACGFEGKGAQQTEFPDGVLSQELEIGRFIPRGRVPGDNLSYWVQRTAHVVADFQSATVDFYATASPLWGGSVLPDGFDIWVLDVDLAISAAALTAAYFSLQPNSAWGYNSATVSQPYFTKQVWLPDATQLTIAQRRFRPFRIRRGALIGVGSQSTGALTCDFSIELGIFPQGFAQDVTV